MKVVIFERDCGATTDFSTHVSALPAAEAFGSDATWFRPTAAGNVFVATTNHGRAPSGPGGGPRVQVQWIGSKRLRVAYDKSAAVFLAARAVSGLTVEYGTDAVPSLDSFRND